jgi:hypothetical protein
VIGVVHKRGHDLKKLLWYLFGPGRACEHTDPRVVGGWRHPAELEPPSRPDGHRDFRELTGLMELPLLLLADRAPREHVWHLSVRAAPGDPELGDGAWMNIAAEIMDRTGLSPRGDEEDGCPWVAVHHGDNHVHIVAVLARQDGRQARLHNDFYRIGEALSDIEAEYGLQPVARRDRTAARAPSRAEQEKARAAGRSEPPRTTLRRLAAAAAAAARSEPEFFAGLEQRGVQVRLRYSSREPGTVTGYAVGLPGDLTAGGGQVWYGGGKLAPDLTLPKLRLRWPGPEAGPGSRPGRERLAGGRMNDGAARAALRREVTRAAVAARSEREFLAGLKRAGLLVRLRPGETGPAGYAVSLPGMTHHRDGAQVWYGGQTLDPALSLQVLRRRWRAGLPGAPALPGAPGDAEAGGIYAYAATVAADAARRLRTASGPEAADIAWAAADLLAAVAEETGSAELRRAADGFARAGRAPWGRITGPSPAGSMLRTAAWLLASCRPGGQRPRVAKAGLITALGGLGRAIAGLRDQQQRQLQAAAAREAAAGLAAAGIPPWAAPPRPAAAASRAGGPGRGRPPERSSAGQAAAPRAGPRL